MICKTRYIYLRLEIKTRSTIFKDLFMLQLPFYRITPFFWLFCNKWGLCATNLTTSYQLAQVVMRQHFLPFWSIITVLNLYSLQRTSKEYIFSKINLFSSKVKNFRELFSNSRISHKLSGRKSLYFFISLFTWSSKICKHNTYNEMISDIENTNQKTQ